MIVVDASALTAALTDDGTVGRAAERVLGADRHWVSPSHLLVEVTSAIRGLLTGRKINQRRADDAIDTLGNLAIDEIDMRSLLPHVWRLRNNFWPYDAAYVVAAQTLNVTLVTADAKLYRAAQRLCQVRLIVA